MTALLFVVGGEFRFSKIQEFEFGQVLFYFFISTILHKSGRFSTFFTLKLSVAIFAPTGTVYMLLCNEGRHSEEQRQFDW